MVCLAGRFDQAAEAGERSREISQGRPYPVLAERLDLLSYYIAQDIGDCEEAMASLSKFLRLHPLSSHRGQALKAFEALRRGDGMLCA